MGAKRKGARAKERAVNPDEQEEFCALSAIYAEDLKPQDDAHGFRLRVVPSPGAKWQL